jgi:DNA repair exonuclease SbcCD ATPase subunit
MSKTNGLDTPNTETVETEKKTIDNFDPEAQRVIRELRDENAKRRNNEKTLKSQIEEFNQLKSELDAQKEAKLKEDGKLQELITEKEKQIQGYEPKLKTLQQMEDFIQKELDARMAGLKEEDREWVNNLSVSLVEKFDAAKRLSSNTGKPLDSPGSERPGGTHENAKEIFKSLDEEKDINKRSALLSELEKKSPQLYQTYRKEKLGV